jgi:hypothetical protein
MTPKRHQRKIRVTERLLLGVAAGFLLPSEDRLKTARGNRSILCERPSTS